MRVAVIACVKQEEHYIKEWLDWHVSIGFDHFFLADNNDNGYTPCLESVVKDYIDRGVVTIVDFHDVHPIQPICYNKILEQYDEDYDWYAIIDVDEFISLPRDGDIKTFLSNFDDTAIVFLHWQYYGDNGLIRYEDKPVQERFTQPVSKNNGKTPFIKSLFRNRTYMDNHTVKPFKVSSQHSVVKMFEDNDTLIRRNCLRELFVDNRTIETIPYNDREFDVAYIKHFITKSLEEYMEIKRKRGGALQKNQKIQYGRYDPLRYFFYNETTPDKERFLKENYGIDIKLMNTDNENKFNFCYIIDDNEEQMKMLFNSIDSLIQCYGVYKPIVYIVNLEDNDSEYTQRLLSRLSSITKVKIVVKHFDKNVCKMFTMPKNACNRSYLGFNSLSRFFLPYILDCKYLYYVDNDILFVKDNYRKLTSFPFDGYLLRMYNQYDDSGCHINAGFMFINCKKWRHDKTIFWKILDYYTKNQHNIKYMNQSCYIWLATEEYATDCVIVDDKNINSRTLNDGIEIFHGNGKSKDFYWKGYEKFIEQKSIDDDSVL